MTRSVLLLLLLAVVATGCSTLPGARPLSPGEHEVGLTFGGPLFRNIGAPIPMPMANLQARHGLAELADRPLELNYGLNLTPIAFGVLQGHIGAGYQLSFADGALPAFAVTNRLYAGANVLDPEPAADVPVGVWGMDQLELSASWDFGNQSYMFVSLSEYLDFGAPSLLLAPAVGVLADPGEAGGISFGGEVRWYGLNRRADVDTVKWIPSGGPGALGVSVGVSYAFR